MNLYSQKRQVMGNQKQKISYALEYKGDKTIKVKAIAKECCIRIDIPGKTFAQIRLKVERAVYPMGHQPFYDTTSGAKVMISFESSKRLFIYFVSLPISI